MNKYALVTGATGGIGKELARLLALRGWNLALTGRNVEKLNALAIELEARGTRVHTEVVDLAKPGAAEELVARLDAAGVEVGLLANNAGLGITERFVESDFERQRALVQVDVVAVTELCHLLGGRMAAAGEGAILNVASVAGTMPGPGMSTYFASKAYVLSLSQALHDELAEKGVRVMALCPGPVATAFWDVAGSDVAAIEKIMLTPEEVARIALTALDNDRAVCAPGLLSKVCYGFGRLTPSWVSRTVAGIFNHLE